MANASASGPDLGERLLSRPQVEAKCAMSRSAIYSAMREGDFPLPIRIGRQAVRWKLTELDAWISERERSHGDVELDRATNGDQTS